MLSATHNYWILDTSLFLEHISNSASFRETNNTFVNDDIEIEEFRKEVVIYL